VVVAVVAVVLWPLSYRYTSALIYGWIDNSYIWLDEPEIGHRIVVKSGGGGLEFRYGVFGLHGKRPDSLLGVGGYLSGRWHGPGEPRPIPGRPYTLANRLGFGYFRRRPNADQVGDAVVYVPYYFVAATSGAAAALLGRPAIRRWVQRRRRAAGRCGACGYDLRGTPDGRCPECGTTATAALTPPGATGHVLMPRVE